MAVLDRIRARTGAVLQQAADALRGASRPGVEIGWGGSKITAGILRDEHVAALAGRKGTETAVKMRRSSAQVRATTQIISLPIRSTTWFLEEPDGAGAAEKEAAELLRANLWGGMEHSFDDMLREACLAIYFGFRVPEIVWEEREGRLDIGKLASRNPELLERWEYDEDGKLVGYLYTGNRPRGAGLDPYAAQTTQFERISIPIEKTVHFIYDGENDSPEGFGLWRSQYQSWYFLQAIYKVLGVGIERNLLDVPVGKMGQGAQTKDRQAFLTLLKRWRAAEDAALVLPEGYELEFQGSNRALIDAMPFLNHHSTQILQTGLCAFLALGQTSAGTQALGDVLGKFFETSEEANARWIEATLQQQLVKRWALLNYGAGLKPPLIRHKPIRSQDLAAWGNALQQMMSAGALHPTVDDEEFVRDTLELPKIPKEQLLAAEAERKAAADAAAKNGAKNPGQPGQPGGGDSAPTKEKQ